MEQNEFLPASEQLTAFLDGELEASEASSLFYELAQNPELQEEMKELLLIRNGFRNKQMVPPASMKKAVFANAGFGESSGFILWNFFKKPYAAVLAGLVLLVSGFLIFKDSDSIDSVLENHDIPISESYAGISSDQDNINLQTNNTNLNNTNSSYSNVSQNNFVRNTDEKSNSQNSVQQIDPEQEISSEPRNIIYLNGTNNIAFSKTFHPNGSNRSMNPISSYFSGTLGDFLQKLNLQFRFANGLSYPDLDLNNNNAMLNDFAAALIYDYNAKSSFGFEFGRENFQMQFEGYEGDILYQYPQSYNTFTWGMFYQYNFGGFDFLDNAVNPYSRIFAGGTPVGPLGRLQAGINYRLTHNVSFMVGADYGILLYSHENNLFNTQKLSWSAGLSVGL